MTQQGGPQNEPSARTDSSGESGCAVATLVLYGIPALLLIMFDSMSHFDGGGVFSSQWAAGAMLAGTVCSIWGASLLARRESGLSLVGLAMLFGSIGVLAGAIVAMVTESSLPRSANSGVYLLQGGLWGLTAAAIVALFVLPVRYLRSRGK